MCPSSSLCRNDKVSITISHTPRINATHFLRFDDVRPRHLLLEPLLALNLLADRGGGLCFLVRGVEVRFELLQQIVLSLDGDGEDLQVEQDLLVVLRERV